MEPLGEILRRRRSRLGWTLAQLAEAAGCSKAYLSGIENGRHPNPPSPPLLGALERALELEPGRLRRTAEWQTTPASVKAAYRRLEDRLQRCQQRNKPGRDLDALYRSGTLQRSAGGRAENLEPVQTPAARIPLINNIAAGYPTGFTDLGYPARVADEYVNCPASGDPDAFAARVVGESMLPTYRPGDMIVFSPIREATDGADCFIRLLPDHESTFKRVHFEPDGRVRLQPLNAAFTARTVDPERIAGLYPAVLRMQQIG